ncbi:MAG TPA: LuxR C-terminal-related transcriptional regulator [Pseudonocardiaceae bacterium]
MSSILQPASDVGINPPIDGNRYTPRFQFPQHPIAGSVDDFLSGPCESASFFRRSALAWYDGRLDVGLRYAAAAVDARCDEDHEPCQLAPFWHVALLTKARELEAGWRALNAIEMQRGAPDSARMTATSHVIRGELLFVMGRVGDGLSEVNTGLRLAESCGARSLLPIGYVVMALGALRRADMRTCQHYVDKLTGEALLGYLGQAAGALVAAQSAEARGRTESAATLIDGIVTNPLVLRQLLVSEPSAASWLVRASTKMGAQGVATAAVDAAWATAAKHPRFAVIQAAALHASGLLEGDCDKLLEAANLYPDRWCVASAREDMANLLAQRGSDRGSTVRILESVLGSYTAIVATRDASRVVNKLRDFGVRRGATRNVDHGGDLPHGLTNTEYAVAELVSQGHTNNEVGRQLFISRHTVAFHLKKVYQKMSVTSRVELAAIWKAMQ